MIKPRVSASAHRLKRIFKGEPVQVNGPAMVQQFMPEILNAGEWSLVFVGGQFSHAVLKLPAAGDFRVQSQFGGTVRIAQPTLHMVGIANKILDSLPDRPLYARVDGIMTDNGFVLMEVELIEPVLFLASGRAVERFVEAIVNLPGAELEKASADVGLL